MDKLIFEVAVNETVMRDENPHVPITPEEIARDAAECAEADAVHSATLLTCDLPCGCGWNLSIFE